jgi:hypothetical protein
MIISVTESTSMKITITETNTVIKVQTGLIGPQGIPGPGIIAGGTTNQVLRKIDGTDFNTEWASVGSGDVSGPGSSVDDNLASFNGTGGTVLQDSGIASTDVSTTIGFVDQDVTSGSSPTIESTNITFLPGETVKQTLIDIINYGILDKGTVTDDGGLNISWDANYELYEGGTPSIVEIQAGSGTCADNAVNYLVWTTGTTLTLRTSSADILSGEIGIARISCQAGDIRDLHQEPSINARMAGVIDGLEKVVGNVVNTGLLIEEDTDVTNPLDVKLIAGSYYIDMHTRVNQSEVLSRTTPLVRHFKVAGAWAADTNAEVDPTKYNDGTNLVATTAAKYYKSLFIIDSGIIHWVYPTVEYNNVGDAVDGDLPTIPPGLTKLMNSTALVMKGDATTLPSAGSIQWIDERPFLITGGTGATITAHSNLTELTYAESGHTGFASSTDLTTHTSDSSIHNTIEQIQDNIGGTVGGDGFLQSANDHLDITYNDAGDALTLTAVTTICYFPTAIEFGNTNQEYDVDGTTWVTAVAGGSLGGIPDEASSGHKLADCIGAVTTALDNSYLAVRENTGAASPTNPNTVHFLFTNIPAFDTLDLRVLYSGSLAHVVGVEFWNYTTSAWVRVDTIASSSSYLELSDKIFGSTNFIGTGGEAGNVKLQIIHDSTGNNGHRYEFDLVSICDGGGGGGAVPTTTEFSDDVFKIFDNTDPTKEIKFQASNITASTTRTITMADADVDLAAVNSGLTRTIVIPIIGAAGGAIVSGLQDAVVMTEFAGTIQKATLLAKETGSIVIEVWKDSYANYPPTIADKISASAPPTLSSSNKSQDSTLTGWTKTFLAGDIFKININSASTVTYVTLILTCKVTG